MIFVKCETRAAFLECALWATNDDEGPLDDRFSFEDVSEEALARAARMVDSFLSFPKVRDAIDFLEVEAGSVGHDLFLSANGHGSGFWDRGYGESGEDLHDAAKSVGSYELYVGDDGLVYVF